jgi:hypothetical protein
MSAESCLLLAEAPLVCRKCRDVKWQRLSPTIECASCLQSVVPASEKISEERGKTIATYTCGCGNSWTAQRNIERRCHNDGCDGTLRLLLEAELTATPIAAECCGTICWELLGAIGSDVQCRTCTKHTPATRRIGINHLTILTALRRGSRRRTFAITGAQVGPVIFCRALPARDHPRTRGLRNCRSETPAPTSVNRYDALLAAGKDD